MSTQADKEADIQTQYTIAILRPPTGDLHQTTLSDVRLVPPSGEMDETYATS